MPATRRRCSPIRSNEGRGVIGSKPEKDRLAVQLAITGLLVGRSTSNCPIQKPDRLKGANCASDPVFGQSQVGTICEHSAVNRECINDPAWCRVIPRQEDR
jgi:hypothetical protein